MALNQPNFRVSASTPFPSLVQAGAPLTLAKNNGVYTFGMSTAILQALASPFDPATKQLLTFDKVTQQWRSVLASQLIPSTSLGLSGIIFLVDFGVTADGLTDDTAAINACFASVKGKAAIVVWPPGLCKTTGPIIVGDLSASNIQSHISIQGISGVVSGIHYFGPTNGTALVVAKNTNFSFHDLYIQNGVGRNTTTGIVFGGTGFGGGNETNSFYLNGVATIGFHIGMQAGGNSGAASEGTFENCILADCDTGWTAIDFNSLDFNFFMCSLGQCGVGIDNGVASGYTVVGGSASNQTIADFVAGNNAVVTITGFRSEVSKLLVDCGSAKQVAIKGCISTSPTSPFVSVGGIVGGALIVEDCSFDGSITLTNYPNVVQVARCSLGRWDTTRQLPFFLPVTNAEARTHSVCRGNIDGSAFPPAPILDFDGAVGSGNNGSGTTVPFYEGIQTLVPQDITGVPTIGCDYLALSHVRQLSEATIPGARVGTGVTPGQNLRITGKFATSNSLTVNFVRTNVVVSATGDGIVTATTGTFISSDAGKPLKITAGADTGADWYGYILDVIDATHAHVFAAFAATPGGRYPQCTTKATVLGANEPDALYMVAGLCGDANETFWVTGIGTTGFTLHSSNATSTSTVTALIVR